MTLFVQACPQQLPSREAERFLRLLAEVARDQQALLEENRTLRARVRQLEADAERKSGPPSGAGRRP